MTNDEERLARILRTWHTAGPPDFDPTEPVSRADLPNVTPIRRPEPVPGTWRIDPDAYQQLLLGHQAMEMDDKWHAFTEAGTVHLIRSWTGFEIFRFEITPDTDGAVIGHLERETDPDVFTGSADDAFTHFALCLAAVFGAGLDPTSGTKPGTRP
ncbi:MAG: hypothetical protein ACOYOQ_14865 [Microthrixaceae bacterium]